MKSQINLVVLLWKGYRFYFLCYLVNVNIVLAPQQKKKQQTNENLLVSYIYESHQSIACTNIR